MKSYIGTTGLDRLSFTYKGPIPTIPRIKPTYAISQKFVLQKIELTNNLACHHSGSVAFVTWIISPYRKLKVDMNKLNFEYFSISLIFHNHGSNYKLTVK